MYHAGTRYCCGAVDVDMLARDGARSGCRCRVQLALASLAHAGPSNSLRWCDAYAVPPAGSRSCCRVAGNPWLLLLELARRGQDAFAERSRSTCLRVLPSNHDRPSCSKNPRSAFQNHGVRRLPDVAFGWSATAVPPHAAARESLTTPGAQVQFHP